VDSDVLPSGLVISKVTLFAMENLVLRQATAG
jgi:hypothetical protein